MTKTFNKQPQVNNKTKDMRSQLNDLLGRERTKTYIRQNARYIDDDGVTYVNIGNNATTPLGRALCPSTALTYSDPIFGEFAVIDSMILYISHPEDFQGKEQLRVCTPVAAYKIAQKAGIKLEKDIINRQYHIARGIWSRIMSSELLKECLRQETLPFAFTVPSKFEKQVFTPRGLVWLGHEIRTMRNCLLDGHAYQPYHLVEDGEVLEAQILQDDIKVSGTDDEGMDEGMEEGYVQDYVPENEMLAQNSGGMGVVESYDEVVNGGFVASEEQLEHANRVLEAQASESEQQDQ